MQKLAAATHPTEGSPYAKHIPSLDGIRGVAVLGVAASHVYLGNAHTPMQQHLRSLVQFGASGVDMFFVLSGFLITGILYDSLPDPGYFRKFYARRTLRIFPLYYGILAAFGLAAVLFGLDFHGQLLSLALYAQNTHWITVPLAFYDGPTGLPLRPLWSLAVEEQFYLVWPLCVFFLRKRKPLLIFCVASFAVCPLLRILAGLHNENFEMVRMTTLYRADSLLAGAAIALLLRTRLHDRVLRTGPWLFLAGAAAVLLDDSCFTACAGSPRAVIVVTSLGFTALAAAYSGVLLLALACAPAVRLFSLAPLRSLGRYSYGFYMLHVVGFTYLQWPVRNFLSAHQVENRGLVMFVTGTVPLLCTYVVAWLSYNLYERRFLRLKRYFDYRKQPSTVA
jgi:peptidoglycan/LPS O-acetylase OafA/YrhL